jgi:L-iditol 2-dehydrogenase
MKAVVKTAQGTGNVKLLDIDEPTPLPHEVKIEVKAAGICGTDIHLYYDEYPNNPPVVLGHEFSGVIAELGSSVTGLKIGDRVVAITAASTCGKCVYCRTSYPFLCSERKSIGSHVNGAFAKYLTIRADAVFKIPDNVDDYSATLCEPLSCCVHGVIESTGISAGDVVLVSGPGAIGILAAQVAKAEGGIVILCGRSQRSNPRLKLARELGIDYTINTQEEDINDLINKLTDGYGVDVAIECSGNESAANFCFDHLKKRGKLNLMGLYGKKVNLDTDKIVYKEINITSSFCTTPSSWEKSLFLLSLNKVKTSPLITHKLPLESWETAFKLHKNKEAIKIILEP